MKIPKYGRKTKGGQTYAVVTLPDRESGKRKEIHLGLYNTPSSRELYARTIAAWERAGRSLSDANGLKPRPTRGLTFSELAAKFIDYAAQTYSRSQFRLYCNVIRVARSLHGTTPVLAIGPNALREIRAAMVAGEPRPDSPDGRIDCGDGTRRKPRQPWSRKVVNRSMLYLIQIFQFGVSYELMSGERMAALREIKSFRRGQTTAHDCPDIEPVPDEVVEATLPFLEPALRDMVEIQRHSGMRPAEVCAMRTGEIKMHAGGQWTYSPALHKNTWRGKPRIVKLGPRARELLKPYLRTTLDEKIFTFAGGQHAQENAAQVYGQCITRAADNANAAAIAAQQKRGREIPAGMRLVPRWAPNQLRHSFATKVAALDERDGLLTASTLLGHSSARMTAEVYVQHRMRAAEHVVEQIG